MVINVETQETFIEGQLAVYTEVTQHTKLVVSHFNDFRGY